MAKSSVHMSEIPLSVVIPVLNEASNLQRFYKQLFAVLSALPYQWEIIFVDDGSTDQSFELIRDLGKNDVRIKLVQLTRNFGKEAALCAGLRAARGSACITLDGDLQHPMERLPEFIAHWQAGAEVVVGVRQKNHREGIIKRLGSFVFYKIFNAISDTKLVPNATDFRLLTRPVVDEFVQLTERNRLNRALIDWLGFKTAYVYFEASERCGGKAGYGLLKLIRLAVNSFVSLSLLPLRTAGYLGIIISFLSGALGLYILIGKYLLHTSFASSFSGSAQLAILIIFLVGILLISLGLVALYVAQIHGEVINRPMYVVRKGEKL